MCQKLSVDNPLDPYITEFNNYTKYRQNRTTTLKSDSFLMEIINLKLTQKI